MAVKFNMNPLKNPMPTQDAEIRNGNFDEVALGYTAEMAIDEAKRCIRCKNRPCVAACPVNIKIPEFIEKVADGDFEGAYQIIAEDSSLPAVCGRVCPQETQCEGKCTRGIKAGCEAVGIGRLERFVADWHNANCTVQPVPAPLNGHKVAVVGSGPAGLTCAGDLAKMGYEVTVFEALHVAGGVLVYNLKALGVKVETNMVIGRVITIEELKTEYGFDAVFIGSGAGLPKFMNIPGESLKGVYSANEFLTRSNLMKAYKANSHTPIQKGKCVAVVGGGNVAMDAARTAKRLGAEVHIIYRRGEEELPARREEIEHAKEEGIVFDLLTNPTKILATDTTDMRDPNYGWVNGIECVRMELGEPDESGRRSPKAVAGSEFVIPVDCVIMSLGTSPNPLLKATTPDLQTLRRGEIAVDEVGKTSIEGVYCGGDAATGAATVIKAMGAGKVAAKAIDEYIQNK